MTQPRPRRRLVARYTPTPEGVHNPCPSFHICSNCPKFSRAPESKVWTGEYHERTLCFTCLHILATGNYYPFLLPLLHNPYRFQ